MAREILVHLGVIVPDGDERDPEQIAGAIVAGIDRARAAQSAQSGLHQTGQHDSRRLAGLRIELALAEQIG